MSRISQPLTADTAVPTVPCGVVMWLPHWLGIYMELGKARLSALVVATTAVGYLLAGGGGVDWAGLLWTVAGTALAALGANGLNQVWEMERDRRMPRTRHRPLPSCRISGPHAAAVSLLAAGVGVTLLAAMTNAPAAGLCLLTIAIYILLYTPLKVRTTLNTLVGALVGAIPPMLGWAAVAGRLDAGAWALGAVLFVWQVPHFLALAWLYREDYQRGGYRMLPGIDPTGAVTFRVILLWCLALVPVTLAVTWVGVSGWLYMLGALVLGLWLMRLALGLLRRGRRPEARRLFVATVLYLPLLMGLMVVDQPSGAARRPAPSVTSRQTDPPTPSAADAPLLPMRRRAAADSFTPSGP